MKRTTTSTIFRTVVFAGAMLGAPACKKNNAQPTTPSNASNATPSTTDPAVTGDDKPAANPATPDPCASADPCNGDGRPRGTDDDGGGGEGRGFILS